MEQPNSTEAPPAFFGSAWVTRYLPGAGIAAYFGLLLAVSPLGTRWLDFPVYWEAGKKALAGATVYDVVGHFQYKYSPLVALLFGKLFGAFAFETASWILKTAMVLLWGALAGRLLAGRPLAVAVFLLFFGNALRLDLALGQLNALVFAMLLPLFAWIGRARSPGRDLAFGLLFSLAVQLKLFSLVIVPLLVLRREWRKLALGLAFLPILSVGGVALAHGWDFALAENREWLRSLAASTDELLVSPPNVGLLGVLARAVPGEGLAIAKSLWLVAGAAFLFYLWERRARPVDWFRDQLLFAIAVFNPLVWSYWILFAFPLAIRAFAAVRRREAGEPARTRIFVALELAFVFAAFNGQHARWAWNGGLLAGLFLVWDRASRERKTECVR